MVNHETHTTMPRKMWQKKKNNSIFKFLHQFLHIFFCSFGMDFLSISLSLNNKLLRDEQNILQWMHFRRCPWTNRIISIKLTAWLICCTQTDGSRSINESYIVVSFIVLTQQITPKRDGFQTIHQQLRVFMLLRFMVFMKNRKKVWHWKIFLFENKNSFVHLLCYTVLFQREHENKVKWFSKNLLILNWP